MIPPPPDYRLLSVIVPVFNVDGHEYFSPFHRPSQNGPKSTGLRANAQRLNLNRDYIKADTPEMRQDCFSRAFSGA